MQALFVHGMGRTPLSGWGLLRALKSNGIKTSTFAYSTAFSDFSQIAQRLSLRIAELATHGEYILIGHSLGGVLLRAALALLPAGTPLPRHLFLLGSPIRSARLARILCRNPLYRLLTQDRGQLLASEERMGNVAVATVPTMAICGERDLFLTRRAFGDEVNDGVVSVAETSGAWVTDQLRVPVGHTFMPASQHVAEIVLEKLKKA